MWADVIVLSEPLVDDDLSLLCCGEPFGVEHLAAQSSVKSFVVSILPGLPGIDPDRLDTDPCQPVLHRFRDELGAIVGTDIFWSAVAQE